MVSSLSKWYEKRSIKIAPYLFIAPNIILFLTFMVIPIFFTFYISFQQWGMFGKPSFIGLENYSRMFGDKVFWISLRNTVYYTAGTVPFSAALGLIGALMLNQKVPLRAIFRTIFFAPVVVSLVAAGLIWSWMFNPNYGLFNEILSKFGVHGVDWLSSSTWAMPAVILTTLWVRIGYCLVIYLAGLQAVPDSLYEAADMDGANGWQKFWRITLPTIKPTTTFILVMEIIHGFMVFDLVFTMTKGGPGYSTTVIVQYIYQKAFTEGEMGYASAIGTFFFILVMILTLVQMRLGREKQ
ncbi:alpha-1,4-digalacturonate transport system permease protein [Fictibacillus solisalsi]|uniref:Alpha-1,4-digalacturonate transport system permease protein n=1 Tax=Fictibacillus solisalsi TaxID=459525 RepID=A0A1G9YKX6_9BACL|nr:sugar ABC transporter permease [Fictibacillus solisalsi]SDN09754.1 alpha-1,4-digalacturonate transport system permease protein [Fictibacillus solisalsi]